VQRGNRIHQRQGFLRVVPVRARQTHGERYAAAVADQMALAPTLGPIGGIRTSLVTAVYRAYATTVHDRPRPKQSGRRARANSGAQSGSDPTRPPACQSRKRRQQVIPDPHPSSCGSICHGIPLRRRQCLSGTRDPRRAADHPVSVAGESAREVPQDPTTDLAAARRPYLFTLLRRRESRFGGLLHALRKCLDETPDQYANR